MHKVIFKKQPNISWDDIKDCAEMGMTIKDASAVLNISDGALHHAFLKKPDIHNLFDRNRGRASWKARRGYVPDPDWEMPPLKFANPVFLCVICQVKVKRTNAAQKYCKPCAKKTIQLCNRKCELQRQRRS